jgi:uncharacterized protein
MSYTNIQHMINRPKLIQQVASGLTESPVTALLGARQTGKTTLARMIADQSGKEVHWFDLESMQGRRALEKTPELTLSDLKGLVVIDEVQRTPELFALLRPLADRPEIPARFLLLGSAAPELVRGASESLAGRIQFVQVPGLSLDETGGDQQYPLWFRGGFPRSFLAASDEAARRWLDGFIRTFLERDIPQLGIQVPAPTLRRFWNTVAHYHGQVLNASELARTMDVTPHTARHYLDILCGAFMLRQLQPWSENLKKRQVKSPKIYLRDSGLLHALLELDSLNELRTHPRYGASWEGFALEQVLARFGERNAFFWATQRGAELDLMLVRSGRRWGFEFKCSDAPDMTRSMHIAMEDLQLQRLFVIYPGTQRYALNEKVEAVPLCELSTLNL